MAREYINRLGRFNAPDPLGGSVSDPQSLDRYAYARTDPVNNFDPTGQQFGYANPAAPPPGYFNLGFTWTFSILGDDNIPGYEVTMTVNIPVASPQPSRPSSPPPNKKTPWYKNPCIIKALKASAVDVGVDSLEFIPEVGGASSLARSVGHLGGYVGVVADNVGSKVIKEIKDTANGASGVAGLSDTSPEGLAKTVLGIAGFIPVANDFAAVLSIGIDLNKLREAIKKCK
jgi:hypothetical protein